MSILPKNLLSASSSRLPFDGLPYLVQDIIITFAKALNCPAEFVIGALMSATAQAAGNRFVWKDDKYTCYPQFYTALLGDSTANKTSTIRKLFKPLENADRQSYYEWEQTTSGMKKEEKARTPYKIGLLQDYTLEAYQDALKFNPNGVTAFADEILTFFGNFNKYRGGTDEKFFLSSFANYADYKRTRRGAGLDLIAHPIVRIIGGIQPEVLQPTFGGSTMLADGMLPRFLWYAVPDDFRFDETGVATNTQKAESDWDRIISRLLNQQECLSLVFDDEAQQLYTAYKVKHSKAKNAHSLHGYEASVCGKLEIYAVIWAMTSRILRYAADEMVTDKPLVIQGYDMQHSLACMDYFQHTAMMVNKTITGGVKLKPADCIRGLKDLINNQSQFAKSIGYSQQRISDIINEK